MTPVLLELPYLPNVQWCGNFLNYENVIIEHEENFLKSTYRNRCEIAGANGKMILSVPVEGGRDHHQKYKDVRIAYKDNWQNNHWQSIRSAYGRAPYFEYYADRLLPVYETRYEYLYDFNVAVLKVVLWLLKSDKPLKFTSVYEKIPTGIIDLRSGRSNKEISSLRRYYQVFEERHGFMPNLSVIDALFNLGPQTKEYLAGLP
ncbi:MAG TPA: WbqC family protein [Chitinophagales bacterium]|nr:WbqC family protein [Chitinophagales bacterium]